MAGLTAACELAEHGFEVSLYDKGAFVGEKSCSWYAGGMLAPWCERESAEEAVIALGKSAADWWSARVSNLERNGSLVLAQPRDQSDLIRFSRRTSNFEWVDQTQIGKLEQSLDGRFRKGLYFAEEAHLNPRKALSNLLSRLTNLNVLIHFETDGYASSNADITIDATGFAAREKINGLRGVKGEMLILKSQEITLSRPVRMLHPRIPLYIVPGEDDHFMIGATMIESAERGPVTARSLIELLSGAYALHPAFGEAEVVETGTDVRPAFIDNLPQIIEQDGVYYINGLYRHGFLLAPAMAIELRKKLMKKQEISNLEEVHAGYRQRASA